MAADTPQNLSKSAWLPTGQAIRNASRRLIYFLLPKLTRIRSDGDAASHIRNQSAAQSEERLWYGTPGLHGVDLSVDVSDTPVVFPCLVLLDSLSGHQFAKD